MAKRVFISFRIHELGLRNDLLQFFQENGGPIQATPAYMTQNLSAFGEDRVKAAIREQMQGCAGLIVLVGDDVHNSRWINYEAGVANEFRIPKVAVRHRTSTGGLPNAHKGMQEVDWDPQAIAAVVARW